MAIQYPQRYDDDFLNTIKTVIDHVNAHGKTIQDLVAEGQLTEEQYTELLTAINGLIKSGHVDKSDLTPEFKDEIERFNTQLAQKVGGGKRASLNDLNEEVLAAIEGGEDTTFNLESIPSDYSVTPEKTTFIEKSKNLFDGEYRRLYMNPNGYVEEGATGNDRGIILELEPNTDYTISKSDSSSFRVGFSRTKPEPQNAGGVDKFAFDDANANEYSFQTDSVNVYLIVYVGSGKVPDFVQIEKGSEATEWVTYGNKLKNEAVPYFLSKDTENPSYYGIKGDGITDDTKALKDYAGHLRELGGGVLNLPKGKKILIKGTISIPSNVLLDGNMSTLTLGDDYVLDARDFRGSPAIFPYIVTDVDSENVHYRDFTVIGNQSDIRSQRHVGVGLFDVNNGSAENVNAYYINYDTDLAEQYGTMAYNFATVRAKGVNVRGGRFDYGGYECVGIEHSEDITLDTIYSGRGWRTSFQVHRGSKNVKLLNSKIEQYTDTPDSGTITTHGMPDLSIEDLTIANNTIVGNISDTPAHDYNAIIQLMDAGKSKNINIYNNSIKGNAQGIRGTQTDNLKIIGNTVDVLDGYALYIPANVTNGIVDNNNLNSTNGVNYHNNGSDILLGKNIGIN